MRILITNDDSIHASQLLPLVQWCKKLGELTVVVPKHQQSGKSHGIEIHQPYEVKRVELTDGVEAYTVDSTPADCVRFAILGLNKQFDLVISGINCGFNVGKDIMYSGTAAAVFEAAAQGVPAIALSTSPASYDTALEHLDRIFDYIRDHRLMEMGDLYNINIPPQAGEIRITHQGGPFYSDRFIPQGNDMYQASGTCVHQDKGDLTLDTDAVMHGCISISPLTTNRTDMELFRKLNYLNP